jgi:alpha-amylase
VIGSGGTVDISYEKGGRPVILVPTTMLGTSGICSTMLNTDQGGIAPSVKSKTSAATGVVPTALSLIGAAFVAAVLA